MYIRNQSTGVNGNDNCALMISVGHEMDLMSFKYYEVNNCSSLIWGLVQEASRQP